MAFDEIFVMCIFTIVWKFPMYIFLMKNNNKTKTYN